MSYCRFSKDSSVYVYADVGGYLCCCACSLSDEWRHFSTDDMLAHLEEHRAAGHRVPDGTSEALIADRDENDAWMREKAASLPTGEPSND